jgi:RNA recognition motif-containing protein
MSIFVGNLSHEITQEDLSEVFAEYGDVKRVHLPTDRETGRKRGFAFVELETPEQEASAIAELDGAEWMGRQLKVNEARPREQSNSFGGGGGNRRNNNSFSKRY